MAELPQGKRFWMVARQPTHQHAKTEPKARYSSIEEARGIAGDLAQQNDAPFLVLEAVEVIRPGESPDTGRLL